MEHSYIQGDLELKSLLLYILARAEDLVSVSDLAFVALCDDGFTYFDLTTALADLVNSGHAFREENRYLITEKGRQIGEMALDAIPSSVRMHCDRQLAELNEKFRQARRVRTDITRQPGGWRARLILDGEEDNLLSLQVTLPLREDAEALVARFRKNPRGFYESMMPDAGYFD